MPRTPLFVTVTWLWCLHLTVMTVRAQQPAPAVPSETTPARIWHRKRFAPLYPQPRAAAPQARDAERAPAHEEEQLEPPSHTGLLIAGMLMFASSYLVSAFASSIVSAVNEADCKASNT